MIDLVSYKETISAVPPEFGGVGGAKTTTNHSGRGSNKTSFPQKQNVLARSGYKQANNYRRKSATIIAQPHNFSPDEKGQFGGTSDKSSNYS